jgi:enoyl-CoA hydratase
MASVEVAREGDVCILTLNRPECLNAIDREVLRLLAEHVAAAAADDAVRALVITGSGERAFSAGADVSAFKQLSSAEAYELMRYAQDVYQQLDDVPKVSIAAINGYALGGGLELALACDLRVAAPGAQLGHPEITLANIPGWGGTQRLPRLVGEAVAKDLILTGRLVGAREALDVRLVHRIADADALQAALTLAATLSQYSPTAVALAKRAVHAARSSPEAGFEVERLGVALCFATAEQQEAIRRFTDKKSQAE